jgi:hypothetical protein
LLRFFRRKFYRIWRKGENDDTNWPKCLWKEHLLKAGDTLFTREESHLLIASYAQVGIIVYLAHLGSFVPAHFARIPLMDHIFSRIKTNDSISLGLSAFAVDLDQVYSTQWF